MKLTRLRDDLNIKGHTPPKQASSQQATLNAQTPSLSAPLPAVAGTLWHEDD
jgi:hypothetical protein